MLSQPVTLTWLDGASPRKSPFGSLIEAARFALDLPDPARPPAWADTPQGGFGYPQLRALIAE